MTEKPLRLLLVDESVSSGGVLKANLDRVGRLRVDIARAHDEAMESLTRQSYAGVLIDLAAPPRGIELVRQIRTGDSSLPIFLLAADATLEGAVEGIRAGATNFLQKPVNVAALVTLLERAVAERPLREEVVRSIRRRKETPLADRIVGQHPRLDEVREFARQVARIAGARVLITGESGTGKSSLARVIHDLSGAPGRFVEVNCAAIPATLLESELFGHEKGAFTDAKGLKRGLVELADQGTLLLDEIGALSLELQAKLLQFLENQEIRRIGGEAPIPISTRVIAATNEDLQERVHERSFRVDLLYRLDVAAIEMPPLRAMPEVIPQLSRLFTESLCSEMKLPTPEIGPESFAGLGRYSWPGNARELKNSVERALIFYQDGPLQVPPPPERIQRDPSEAPGVSVPRGLTLGEVERLYLSAALQDKAERSLEDVARLLGISRKTLWEKRRRYDL